MTMRAGLWSEVASLTWVIPIFSATGRDAVFKGWMIATSSVAPRAS